MEYLICAKASFEILINGRMGAENWMKAGCVALLPSVEVAMVRVEKSAIIHCAMITT